MFRFVILTVLILRMMMSDVYNTPTKLSFDRPNVDDLVPYFARRMAKAIGALHDNNSRKSDKRMARETYNGYAEILSPLLGFLTTQQFDAFTYNIVNDLISRRIYPSAGNSTKVGTQRFDMRLHFDKTWVTEFSAAFNLLISISRCLFSNSSRNFFSAVQ